MKEEFLERLQNESDVKVTYEAILAYELATEDELNLVIDVAGCNIETLNAVIFSRTEYRDLEQFLENEG